MAVRKDPEVLDETEDHLSEGEGSARDLNSEALSNFNKLIAKGGSLPNLIWRRASYI